MRDDETEPARGLGPQLNRREVFTFGAAAAAMVGLGLAVGASPPNAQALPPPPGEEVLQNANGFSIDITGAPTASNGVVAVSIEDLIIDTGSGLPKPKKVLLPLAHVSVAAGSPAAVELHQWWQDASTGQCIRKNITINLKRSDGTVGRSYTLNDCFPTQWSSVNFDTSSTVQTETLTVRVGALDFTTL